METEILQFRRNSEVAHVVWDGLRVRIYREGECLAAPTLPNAIAYLEGQGFQIVTDFFWK